MITNKITNLLTSWKDSLSLLIPKNLKLFMLVSFNSFIKGCEIFVRYPLLILAIAIPLRYITVTYMTHGIADTTVSTSKDHIILAYAALLLWCVSIHPSVTRKDAHYFSVKGVLAPSIIFPAPLLSALLFALVHATITHPCLLAIGYSISMLWPLLMLFFSLDSDRTLKSALQAIIHSATMLIYNLPLFSIACFAYASIVLGWYKLIHTLLPNNTLFTFFSHPITLPVLIIYPVILGLLTPFAICVINNIYIKKLYENKNLYL